MPRQNSGRERRYSGERPAPAPGTLHGSRCSDERHRSRVRNSPNGSVPPITASRPPDSPSLSQAVHWNPAGASLEQAWEALGLSGGSLHVIGGTEPFGLFLEIGYDAFHLSLRQPHHASGRAAGVPRHPPAQPRRLAGTAWPETRRQTGPRRSGRADPGILAALAFGRRDIHRRG